MERFVIGQCCGLQSLVVSSPMLLMPASVNEIVLFVGPVPISLGADPALRGSSRTEP